jgi:hypothetical protein
MAERVPFWLRRAGSPGSWLAALTALAGVALLVGRSSAGEHASRAGALDVPSVGVAASDARAGVPPTDSIHAPLSSARHSAGAAPQARPPFTHADHESVQCVSCHTSGDRHGATDVTTVEDCRRCHHRAPTPGSCASCHAPSSAPRGSYQVVRALSFSVGTEDRRRTLTFPHGEHASLDCVTCHTQGLALSVPANLDCQSCHAEHHTPESACASCHLAPPVAAHPPSEAHVTCSGAACHQRLPFQAVPRTRAFCLACHQNMTQHEAPRPCAECHVLPAPRPQSGGGE